MAHRLRYVLGNLLLAGAYVALGKLGLMLEAVAYFATLVWPPTGLAMAVIVLFGKRFWPGIALGAFAVNAWAGAPLLACTGIALGNTLEAVLGAYLLGRVGFESSFGRLRDVVSFVALAALLSTTISASVGVLSLGWAGAVAPAAWVATGWTWWLGDVLGNLLLAPLLLTWGTRDRAPDRPRRWAELLAIFTLLVALSVFIFWGWPRGPAGFRMPHFLFPVLIWATLRFGQRGATTTTFLASAIGIAGTLHGSGPFPGGTPYQSLESLQLFMAMLATTALVLGAAISERERAIYLREELLGIVSHDLRNPLGAIQLSVALMQKKLPEQDLHGSLGRQLDVIGKSVRQMAALIRDLLDLAAIRAGKLQVKPAAQDAGKLIEEAVELMAPLAAVKAQTVRSERLDSALAISVDRERILQVLSNIIGNALKFSPRGGDVSVRAEPEGAWLRILVTDSGPGIAPEQLPHLFERYWRAPSDKAGLGLGLFISQGIVSTHGGRVWAESHDGRGTTFVFTVPLAAGVPAAPSAAAPEQREQRNARADQ
jgi:signal transduction histidine kinase